MSAKEYAKKKGVKYTERRDGTITVEYTMKYQNGDINEFYKRLLIPLRGVGKRLEKSGYKYIADTRNFKWHNYPTVKVKADFKKGGYS